MSAKILNDDLVFSTKVEWHDLQIRKDLLDRETLSPLVSGKIERFPLYFADGQDAVINDKAFEIIAEKWVDLDGKERMTPLHIAGDTYQEFQPSSFFDLIEQSLKGYDYTIETYGTHSNRQNLYASISIKGTEEFQVNKDKFQGFLNFTDSRNGLSAVMVADSNIRICCANTFGWHISQIMRCAKELNMSKVSGITNEGTNAVTARAKHTKNMLSTIEKIKQDIPVALAGKEVFKKVYSSMQKTAISKEHMRKILLGFYAEKTKVDYKKEYIRSTRTLNQIQGVMELAEKGAGNQGKSVADLWNGITQYYTSGNGSGGEKVDKFKKFVSSEFGTAAEIKNQSFLSLMEDSEIDRLASIGDLMLSNALKDKIDLMVAV